MSTKSDNIVIIYGKHLIHRYGVDKFWAFKCACTEVATVLDRNIWTKTNRGFNKLNIWNAVLGSSGTGKSVVIDNDMVPIAVYVSKILDHPFVLPSIASSFEGLTDRARDGKLRGLIVRDELTTFLKEAGGGYTSTVPETYSKLYDGWIYPRATRSVKDVIAPIPVYVNLIAGTTPEYLFPQLKPQFFFQGVGNRIDFERITEEPEHRDSDTLHPDVSSSDLYRFDEVFLDGDQKEIGDELAKIAEQVTQKKYTVLVLDSEAGKISTDYYNKMIDKVEEIPESSRESFKKDYMRRNWQKMLKYSGIMAYTEPKLHDEKEDTQVVFIHPEHVRLGIELVEHNYNVFCTMLDEWLRSHWAEDIKIVDDIPLVLLYLEKIKGYGVISQLKLAYEVGNTSRGKQFLNILAYLLRVGSIERLPESEVLALIEKNGEVWCDQQQIGLKPRGNPPALYRYIKPLIHDTTQYMV